MVVLAGRPVPRKGASMKQVQWFGLLGVLGTSSAQADFVRLVPALEFPHQSTINGPRDVYLVYAEFTNPLDRVRTWDGTAQTPFTIQNTLSDGTTLGTGFYNFGGGTVPPDGPSA